jgi:DNA-binding response OmpR family regulator
MTNVLVVDDEANIRELVSVYLTAAGYSVACAADGIEAVQVVRTSEPDLIVLDIGLPGMSGAEACSAIREFSAVPIVMLTARDTDLDKVALLEAGADDYVVKPFSPPVLVARVRAVLRRVGSAAAAGEDELGAASRSVASAVKVGGLSLDAEEREVAIDGMPIALTAREFDLLMAMARRPGVVFSREQLLEAALGFSDYSEVRGVDVHVRHLREKLGDDAAAPRFIETVRGVGYRVKRDAQ